MGAYKGRYVASLDTQNRPSPWMGEGVGVGVKFDTASPPHLHPPPPGEGKI
jgi:hypothetical protein